VERSPRSLGEETVVLRRVCLEAEAAAERVQEEAVVLRRSCQEAEAAAQLARDNAAEQGQLVCELRAEVARLGATGGRQKVEVDALEQRCREAEAAALRAREEADAQGRRVQELEGELGRLREGGPQGAEAIALQQRCQEAEAAALRAREEADGLLSRCEAAEIMAERVQEEADELRRCCDAAEAAAVRAGEDTARLQRNRQAETAAEALQRDQMCCDDLDALKAVASSSANGPEAGDNVCSALAHAAASAEVASVAAQNHVLRLLESMSHHRLRWRYWSSLRQAVLEKVKEAVETERLRTSSLNVDLCEWESQLRLRELELAGTLSEIENGPLES